MKHWDAVLRITQYLRRVTERKEQSRTGVLHLRILVTVSLTLRQTLIVWILIVPLTTDVQSQDTVLSWKNRSQTTVALSFMDTKYMTACASWLSMLLDQMGVEIFKRFVLKEDY